jgi:hypothetical protein
MRCPVTIQEKVLGFRERGPRLPLKAQVGAVEASSYRVKFIHATHEIVPAPALEAITVLGIAYTLSIPFVVKVRWVGNVATVFNNCMLGL